MRFADAAHLDLASLRARRPELGQVYLAAGYGACLAALWWAHQPSRLAALLIVLAIAWAMAWRRAVGSLYRSTLVAAMLLCAVPLSAARLGWQFPAPPAERPVEVRFYGQPPPDWPQDAAR
ncbi:MAG: hypothetical protein RMM29_02255 [Planctomycetota bacterium]|nr:hypothetical protein [Planctomycetota bacterium]MCX8040245.1 hypothetical protein [Planctomycetota bacterium]MDW8372460.1 hypothetical protein [Planctomycetota bacterium]